MNKEKQGIDKELEKSREKLADIADGIEQGLPAQELVDKCEELMKILGGCEAGPRRR